VPTNGVAAIATQGKADTWGESNSAALASPVPVDASRPFDPAILAAATDAAAQMPEEIARRRLSPHTAPVADAQAGERGISDGPVLPMPLPLDSGPLNPNRAEAHDKAS
jgi:hypothetical protein